jgi:hypothetical protein
VERQQLVLVGCEQFLERREACGVESPPGRSADPMRDLSHSPKPSAAGDDTLYYAPM